MIFYSQFQQVSLFFVILSIIIFITGLLISKKSLTYQIVTGILLTSYVLFVIQINDLNLKYYAYLFPFLHLMVALFCFKFTIISLNNYQTYYDQVELYLSIFYLQNSIVWILLYVLDIISIGNSSISIELALVLRYIGSLLLLFIIGAGIAIYYSTVMFFSPTNKIWTIINKILMIVLGITISEIFNGTSDNLLIILEKNNQMVFSFPNPQRFETMLGIILLFFPYILLFLQARYSRKKLEKFIVNEGRIDPLIVPRIKIIEFSSIIYIVGASFTLMLYILPHYIVQLNVENGLIQGFSVVFIIILIISVRFAFQTPNWVKHKMLQRVSFTAK